jgi:NAD+ kinase
LKKQIDHIRRIGLLGNAQKAACAGIVRTAVRLIRKAGLEYFCNPETARLAGLKGTPCPDAATLAQEVDLLLVFGGDGTILRAARDIAGSPTPVLGVNIGGLGFLTAVSSKELAAALKLVLQGEYTLQSRALIEVGGALRGQKVLQRALNDVVVSRGAVSRLISLDVGVDGEPITRYRCDGLIISSPTGSTAYSLAAGGAIVLPTAEVFTLTPICPHSLSNRSIILPLSSQITVKAVTPLLSTILSADGQMVAEMDAGDEVTIRRSHRAIRLVQLADGSFLEALRRKLHWRGTYL